MRDQAADHTHELVEAIEGASDRIGAAHNALHATDRMLRALEARLPELGPSIGGLAIATRALSQSLAHLEGARALTRSLGGQFGIRLPTLRPPSMTEAADVGTE